MKIERALVPCLEEGFGFKVCSCVGKRVKRVFACNGTSGEWNLVERRPYFVGKVVELEALFVIALRDGWVDEDESF